MIDLHSLYTPKQTETWLHKKWKEMKNKQTAVEWLVQEINKINVSTEARMFINKLKDQAKAMEKEQIIDAYEIGFADAWDDARYDDEPKYATAEQYYNETYKSEYNGK